MQIELAGTGFALTGRSNPVAQAALAALRDNGGQPVHEADAEILLVSCPLLPEGAGWDFRGTLRAATRSAEAMAAKGRGRIVFLLPAIAGIAMRRHPEFSAACAGMIGGMQTLAMRCGPAVLVNAVGCGLIVGNGAVLAGDEAQLSHTPLGRPGTLAEAVAAVLFLCDPANSYTTGQLFCVDGGWSAGYGRNF